MDRSTRLVVAAVPLALAAAVHAQIISKPRLVTQDLRSSRWYGETAIGVAHATSPGGQNELLVGFMSEDDADPYSPGNAKALFSASLDGGATWSQSFQGFEVPNDCYEPYQFNSFDPVVAESPTTGSLWGAAVVQNQDFGRLQYRTTCVVGWKPLGAAIFIGLAPLNCREDFTAPMGAPVDKVAIAVGPTGLGTGLEHMLVSWTLTDPVYPACGTRLVDSTSSNGSPGQSFCVPQQVTDGFTPSCGTPEQTLEHPGFVGRSGGMVILKSGSNAGKAVLAFEPGIPSLPSYTRGTPLDQYGNWSWASQQVIEFALNEQLALAADPNIAGNFSVKSFPSVAADPTNPSIVYIAFPATIAGGNYYDVDIIIAKSEDGGATFPANKTHRLTDALLGETGGQAVAQFMPAICVDDAGKINLLFYRTLDTWAAPDVWMDAYYARLSQFPPASPSDVFVRKLGPSQVGFNANTAPRTGADQSVGHYNGITSFGCHTWVVYMSTVGDHFGIYTHTITLGIPCLADLTADGIVNTADATAFVNAMGTASPAADVNMDDVINVQDAVDFFSAYAASGGH